LRTIIVKNKEIPALDQCPECINEILTLPPKTSFTDSIEKKLLLTVPNTCPFPDCEKNVDILEQADAVGVVSNMQDSPLSQSSGIQLYPM
jgi:hypothetical protein